MRALFPKRKSKLSAASKAISAASVLLAVRDGQMDDKQAAIALRQAVGLQWSLLTAVQYLSGKEAIGALIQLPEDWSVDGKDKSDLLNALLIANDMCANLHPSAQLTAGVLLPAFKKSAKS
jgi:hypothetical protein